MRIAIIASLGAAFLLTNAGFASEGPRSAEVRVPNSAPRDRPFPGEIQLSVDASDINRRIVHVHEVITGLERGARLLYPKWIPGGHAPEGTIDRLSGMRFTSGGKALAWKRDPLDMYAFIPELPKEAASLEVDFDYLSPTSGKVGDQEISHEILTLEWIAVVIYPDGYYARQIPVHTNLTLPPGWKYASALEEEGSSAGRIVFKTLSLEKLIDSPFYAGTYNLRLDLDPQGPKPVHLNIFADRPELLDVKPEQLAVHRALIQQAYKLFGSNHYDHYDFLLSISDYVHEQGTEHHQSSEDGTGPGYFTEWKKYSYDRGLLPHEYAHSWNGKFRRPADLWTPNYSVPMQNSLLWVYEGMTEYWGYVLAARSGVMTLEETKDFLAATAASYEYEPGRAWRSLEDTTNDEIIGQRRPKSWPSWQRTEDYYDEGLLIWLEVDTLIRERSNNRRSLNDFARAFFGINDGSSTPVTYTFSDVVKTLNSIEPYDWSSFLRARVDHVGKPVPLEGLTRGGYKLVYTAEPNAYLKDYETRKKHVGFAYSLGVVVSEKDKSITEVYWGSPAFKANVTEGMELLAVNGKAYTPELLSDVIKAAAASKKPLELLLKNGDDFATVSVPYFDGLKYPHLERDKGTPPRLDDILTAL